jgi:phosphatidate cytidylyltransferase
MKRVLTAVVLAPLVLLAVFRAPLWLFALLVAAVIVLALHEYLHIAEAAGLRPFKWLTYAVSLLPIVALWVASVHDLYFARPRYFAFYPIAFALRTMFVLPVLAPVVFGVALVFRKELQMGLASAAASVFGVFYIGGSLFLLIALRADQWLCILVIFILLSVWAGDIAAYYVGRSIGKHKLAPIVSPNKSWEGAIASVVASIGVAFLVFHFGQALNSLFVPSGLFGKSGWTFYTPLESFNYQVQPYTVIILGVLTNVAAQFGDLFESALKRGANVKDSGTLLPGHGGVLDRIDALLFAIPVVWYYANLTGFLNNSLQ